MCPNAACSPLPSSVACLADGREIHVKTPVGADFVAARRLATSGLGIGETYAEDYQADDYQVSPVLPTLPSPLLHILHGMPSAMSASCIDYYG